MWYAAHIVTVFRYRNRRQRKFHVWENIIIVEAATSREAWEKADQLSQKEHEFDDKSTRMNGIPTRLEFVGIRKVVECQSSIFSRDDELRSGTEITYNKFNVSSRADLDKFVAGEPVDVEYEE